MARLIGLTGPAGCGKSTIAKAILERCFWLDQCAERHRFAGPLKDMLRTLGLTEAQIDGDEKELPCDLLGGKTPRHAMMTIGTEWGREMIDAELWLRATMLRVDADIAAGKFVVIDDLRFNNEAEAILARGGVIVRLERWIARPTWYARLWQRLRSLFKHASEAGVSSHLIDVIVPNQDTPEQVARAVLNHVNLK